MGFDPPDDDDPLADPFADDPLEDPFADDPLDDSFGGDSGGDPFADGSADRDGDLDRAFSEGSSSTLLAFITVAVLVHAGLFGASLGAMLIGFRGQWIVGGSLVIVGFLAIAGAVVRYRRYRDEG